MSRNECAACAKAAISPGGHGETAESWVGTGPNKPVTLHLLENLKLDELVAKNLGEFAFIMEPLKIQGATGSTVTPVAVR